MITRFRLLISFLVVVCLSATVTRSAQAQEITIALGSEPTTLDPQVRQDGGERAVNDNIYETLIARTVKGELVPGLAAAMPTQVNATTWRFKLRPNVKFHNGEPFNAESVVATISRMLDPALKSENLSYFNTLVKAEKVDDLTVDVYLKSPDSVFLSRMYWMKIIPAKYSADGSFASKPVGTGPYKLVEWSRGERVVLSVNPDYWGGRPQIQKVTFKFVQEPGTRLSGLMAKEFDLITNLSPEFVKRVPKVAKVEGLEHPVIVLNAMSGLTGDVRVRQALNYAVDKKALAEKLFGGHARVDDGQVLSPTWFGYDPNLKAYPHDLVKAKQLLKEAGVAPGTSIELIGTSGRWLKDKETTEAVAAYWTEAGLNVDVKIFEFDNYLKRLFDRQTRPMAIYVSHANPLLHADRTLSDYYLKTGRGSSNADDMLAELVNKARGETDSGKQLGLYHQAVKRGYDNALFSYLVGIELLYGVNNRLDWVPGVDTRLLIKDMKLK
jgi:peptide/nickel transport system substrate-binding protein